MATHFETITVGTSATKLYPTAPVTTQYKTVGSFSPPSDIYVGDDGVTTSNGRVVTADDEFAWHPGREDIWAVAASGTDIDVLFTEIPKGELGGYQVQQDEAPS